MELVRRADALPLDRLRDAVRAVREHAVHARGEGRRLPVHVRPRRRPRSPTLPAQPVTSVFYLFRDSPQRRAALALEPGSPARYALYGMDELAGAAGPSVTTSSRRAGPRSARRRRGGETRRRGCGWLRRRLRDRPRVAPRGEPRRRDPVDGRHRRHPADAPGAREGRADAVRLRRDRAAGAARAAPVAPRRARIRERSGRAPRSSRTASTKPSPCDAGCASAARTCPSRSSRSASTSPRSGGRRVTRPRCRLRRSGPAPGLRAPARRRPLDARRALPRRHDRRARPLARRAAAERLRRDRSPVRRDARPARAGAGRRAAGSRQQLLRRDDGSPPGDGAREARRRDADGRDRHGLRPRRRRERSVLEPGDAGIFAAAGAVCWTTRGTRALGVRARATVEAALTGTLRRGPKLSYERPCDSAPVIERSRSGNSSGPKKKKKKKIYKKK